MRILMILTGIVLALFSGDVRADGTVILIAGNAPPHDRDLFRSAMETSIEGAGRKVRNVSIRTKEEALVKDCLSNIAPSNIAPWTCIKGVVALKGKAIDQIVIGSVDTSTSPSGAPAIRLSGYLVVSDLGFAIAEERICDPCTDNALKSLAEELTQAQLRRLAVVRGRTKIAVRTTPPGARITFDDEAQGASDTEISTFPGSHTIRLELGGHRVETRTVEALEGKTVEVNVPMRPKDAGRPVHPPHSRPSRLVPILIGGAGAAAVITGGVLIAIHDPHGPDMNQRHEFYYATRTPGIVTAIGGAAAIGISLYLWQRQSRSAVIAVPLTDGGAVSWNASF